MKKILLTLISFFLFVPLVKAQYTVFNEASGEVINVYNAVEIDRNVFLKVHSMAELDYLQKKQRNERNFLETKNNLYLTQYSYNNWAEGGSNSITARVSSQTNHSYKHKKMTIDSYFNAAYGLNYEGSNKQKKEDNFELNSNVSHVIWNRWSYTFGLNIKSQFTRTYNSERTDYLSTFFAPGTIKPYAGFLFTLGPKRTIMISPLSVNMLFVMDDKLSQAGSFGITPGKKLQADVGIYLNAQWEEKLTKGGQLKYKTNLQSFYDYRGTPNLSWENWIDYDVFKFFSIGLYVKVIYDKKINSAQPWQLKESFGIGLAYNFKNK